MAKQIIRAVVAMIPESPASPAHRADMAVQATMADRAVAHAADKLGERQSVFSAAALQEEAGRIGLGEVSYTEVGTAIDAATKEGALIDRTFLDRRGAEFAGFTTPEALATEQSMLRLEAVGRGVTAPLASSLG